MVRNGIYETKITRPEMITRFWPEIFQEDTYFEDVEIPVEVHWVHEYSEYGDGKLDSDFECIAYIAGTKDVINLTEDEETKIYEQLKDEGAFE